MDRTLLGLVLCGNRLSSLKDSPWLPEQHLMKAAVKRQAVDTLEGVDMRLQARPDHATDQIPCTDVPFLKEGSSKIFSGDSHVRPDV